MIIDVLVEGPTDELVAARILRHCGFDLGTVYGKGGVASLRNRLPGFNVRAQYGNPILTLIDFVDTGFSCPPEVATNWLPNRVPTMLVRVVVPELESWLLADADSLGKYLRISASRVPAQPEQLPDAKQSLVNLARHANNRRLRADIVPAEGYSSAVGPGYFNAIRDFIDNYWHIEEARKRAPSLDRCLIRLGELSDGTRQAG